MIRFCLLRVISHFRSVVYTSPKDFKTYLEEAKRAKSAKSAKGVKSAKSGTYHIYHIYHIYPMNNSMGQLYNENFF